MPYDVTLAQINTATFGLRKANTAWGFPANTNFHTLLMSFWMCGPLAPSGSSGYAVIWPAFHTAAFFKFGPGSGGISFSNRTLGSSGYFYSGTWVLTTPGVRMHLLMSVDTHAQTVQLFINDQPVATADSWTGTPPYDFNLSPTPNIWDWNVSGVASSTMFPAFGDAWISNTPAFVDLSLTTNRRRFINGDLTPVDLGNTGTNPFGYQPALYMSVRPGGVATDIAINRGVGGGVWNIDGVPTIQAPGVCTLPIPPPAIAAPKLWLLRQPELHFIGVKT